MQNDHHPDSVIDEGKAKHLGYNCVACVAAVLYNETQPIGFATANLVASRYNIAPKFALEPKRAVSIIEDFAKVTASPGNRNPWDPGTPNGHYAVFCIGRGNGHVIYGHRESCHRYYLWDPQIERFFSHDDLRRRYGLFRSYHFS